ncbi:hypothetical protein SO802_008948 [Lithocarpus litseifolius]|uniref:Uncharacterized protein n=1 Tax=Lithocarpus litseifolius TaxID=425828 RepID=A0AAW2DFN0_9ROSI
MKCKRHLSDLSSTVGVCASCLRDRLLALIAAQAQAQSRAQSEAQTQAQSRDDPRKSDPNIKPPPLVFPRSVSPYVSRRKSDEATWQQQRLHRNCHQDRRFYSTPQVGPATSSTASASASAPTSFTAGGSYWKKNGRFSLFSNLFRSRSEKLESDPRVSTCEPSAATATTTTTTATTAASTSSSSPSWFAAIFAGRTKKKSRLFVYDESTVERKPRPRADRGMSPARTGDSDEDCERSPPVSGYSTETWRSPAFQLRRTRHGHSRNVSGIAFCLSPLVRASPNRNWSQKGMPLDIAISGEVRAPGKFCKNRSRKLVDFGRVNHNR